MERASQEEQNGVNFSFIAPSCEELLFPERYIHVLIKYMYILD